MCATLMDGVKWQFHLYQLYQIMSNYIKLDHVILSYLFLSHFWTALEGFQGFQYV